MLNKLVSKQHLQGLSCLLQAHLLKDSTKTWSGALVVMGLWALGLYDSFDTVHMRWKNNTTGDWPGLSHSSAAGVELSIPWGNETEVSESGCVHWGAEEHRTAAVVSSLLGLTSTSVFPSRDYFFPAKDVLHIIFINVYKHNMCISRGRERDINIYICVCIYICKYMYVLYTQNLSIH